MSDYDVWVEHQQLHDRASVSIDYDSLRKQRKESGLARQVRRTCDDGPRCNDIDHLEIVVVEPKEEA